jgi:TolB protein
MNSTVFVRSALLGASLACGGALLSQQKEPRIRKSYISVFDLKTKSSKVLFTADKLIEAPNWSPDGSKLLVNTGGELYTLDASGNPATKLVKVDTASVSHCNNDKGFSPDGKSIAFSARGDSGGSEVYSVEAGGGTPKLLVSESPSYFHGFSPDGKWIAVVARRQDNFDLFRLPANGGAQQRLTSDGGYDDGPDYSPDGKWIYFNSNRAGTWDIWRMPAEGAGEGDAKAQRVTSDDREDWFPHCSPDGKWLLFLTFTKGTDNHNGHGQISVRMIRLPGSKLKNEQPKEVTSFFGGQGTINVNSWAPDSRRFAYVRYEQ